MRKVFVATDMFRAPNCPGTWLYGVLRRDCRICVISAVDKPRALSTCTEAVLMFTCPELRTLTRAASPGVSLVP